MTGHADQWLLVLVLGEPDLCRLIVGHRGALVERELLGASRRLGDLFDYEALLSAPVLPGWWLWQGRRETVSYSEDDADDRWCGRWAEATLEDLYRIGLELPRPEKEPPRA